MDGKVKGERIWMAEAREVSDPDTGEVVGAYLDPDELNALAVDAATVVRMCGGVCTFGADRQEIAPGIFETVRVMFRWHSYAPAQRRQPDPEPAVAEEPKVEAVEDPEPVAAG